MSENTKIVSLVVLLFIVIIAIVGVMTYQNEASNAYATEESYEKLPTGNKLLIVSSEVEKPTTNKVILHERFVGEFDKDGTIVVMSSDGQAVNVRSGNVLVNDMVVTSNDEEYSVFRINNMRESVSSYN